MLNLSDAMMLAMQVSRLGQEGRKTAHPDGTPESVTTHTVMLGLIACSIADSLPVFSPGRVAQFVLVHDLDEAVRGDVDTFNATPEDLAKKAIEDEAATMELLAMHSANPWLCNFIEMYHLQDDIDARLVRYLDKAMPKFMHAMDRCRALKARPGVTLQTLIDSHKDQLARLNEEYMDLPEEVHDFLEKAMHVAVGCWES